MSANLHVDIANTSQFVPSITTQLQPSSGVNFGLSGGVVGQWVDMSNSDTLCNIYIAVGGCSGPLGFQVQTAPGPNTLAPAVNSFSGNIFSGGAPASGSFTDPTSGLAQLPSWISSGGIFWVNSGLYTLPGQLGQSGQPVGGYSQGTLPFGPTAIQNGQGGMAFTGSGTLQAFASGGIAFGAFQRNNQYCRFVLLSGATTYPYAQAGFVAQSMTTGSGGGFSFQPLGGAVSV